VTLKLANHLEILYHGGIERRRTRESADRVNAGPARHSSWRRTAFGWAANRGIRFVVTSMCRGAVEVITRKRTRRGRDGRSGTCDLLFNHADPRVQEFFIEGSNPQLEVHRDRDLRKLGAKRTEARAADRSREMGAAALATKARDMMIARPSTSSIARVKSTIRYSGKRVRGTRVLQAGKWRPQLKLDAAKLREKERRGSVEIEND